MKRWLVCMATLGALAMATRPATAELYYGFTVGVSKAPTAPVLRYPSPPELVLASDAMVYVAKDGGPHYDGDLFRYGQYWFAYTRGYWYRALACSGPYTVIDVRRVPLAVIYVPRKHWKHHPRGKAPVAVKRGVVSASQRPQVVAVKPTRAHETVGPDRVTATHGEGGAPKVVAKSVATDRPRVVAKTSVKDAPKVVAKASAKTVTKATSKPVAKDKAKASAKIKSDKARHEKQIKDAKKKKDRKDAQDRAKDRSKESKKDAQSTASKKDAVSKKGNVSKKAAASSKSPTTAKASMGKKPARTGATSNKASAGDRDSVSTKAPATTTTKMLANGKEAAGG